MYLAVTRARAFLFWKGSRERECEFARGLAINPKFPSGLYPRENKMADPPLKLSTSRISQAMQDTKSQDAIV